MSTQTWHADEQLLEAYIGGRLDALLGASVERHLDRCATCRATCAPITDPCALDRAWDGIRTIIESPRQPWLIRQARRLGLPESTSVLLAATMSLRTAWLSSALVALAFSVAAALLSSENSLWPYLLVAPLIPVLGVAASYAPAEDQVETLAVTSPYGRTRLILVRTVAVLVSSVPACCLVGLALPGPIWVAVAWLGPALAMVPLLLVLSGFVGPRLGAGLIAILWGGIVIAPVRRFPQTWPVEADRQLVYLAVAVGAIAVLLVRSRRTHQIGALL